MSEIERGDARAQGAFANFMLAMRNEMANMGRSEEYQAQFWKSLNQEIANHNKKPN